MTQNDKIETTNKYSANQISECFSTSLNITFTAKSPNTNATTNPIKSSYHAIDNACPEDIYS